MKRWYVARTQPRAEQQARRHLLRQGFETYLPRYRKQRRHARRVDWCQAPLFPGYIFVSFDRAAARWRAIHSTIGISHLVCQGERPSPVPAGVVEDIQASEDETGLVPCPDPLPAPGDTVSLAGGPLAGSIGRFVRLADNERVFVLLQLLGSQVRVSVPRDVLHAAPAA